MDPEPVFRIRLRTMIDNGGFQEPAACDPRRMADPKGGPMPIFEYVCESCAKPCELLVRGSREKPLCPHCGSPKLAKQFSTFYGVAVGGGASTPSCETPVPGGCGAPACRPGGCRS